MVEPVSGVVISYNGEVYNYLELRRELEGRGHVFRSSSDTEVLLHGYLEWGERCVERFNGMWAFVIWDPRERRVFFARDRFGVKPFCYAMVDGVLAIASEPKALVHAFPQLARVDWSAVRDLLVEKRVHHDERTFYAPVKSLLAGHRGTFRVGDRGPRIERYWHYPAAAEAEWDQDQALERFSELIDDAVALRLRSDVAVGVTISGGIDSTMILDAMARRRAEYGGGVASYTAVYPDSPYHPVVDERKWARLAAGRYPNVTVTEVPAARERWLETLRKITWHLDGPFRSMQTYPMWTIMQCARADEIPVLLDGQGADEVFGGYWTHAAAATLDRLLEGPGRGPMAGWRALPATAQAGIRAASPIRLLKDMTLAAVPPLRRWSSRRTSLEGVLRDDFLANNHQPARETAPAGRPGRLERQLYQDFTHDILPGTLRFTDAISMAHSVEQRLPFLDYRLVEFGIALPSPARVAAGQTKRLVREHLRTTGQHEIADRGDKKGFPTPTYAWLAAEGGAILKEILLDPDARIRAITDRHKLERALDHHTQGHNTAGEAIYALLTTELWLEQAF